LGKEERKRSRLLCKAVLDLPCRRENASPPKKITKGLLEVQNPPTRRGVRTTLPSQKKKTTTEDEERKKGRVVLIPVRLGPQAVQIKEGRKQRVENIGKKKRPATICW